MQGADDVYTSQHPGQGIERPQLSTFEPGTALESLHAEMIDIEVLARAAEAAADELRGPTTDPPRLAFGRIQSPATKTSQQASASLRFANAQVAELTAQMEAHRKATTR